MTVFGKMPALSAPGRGDIVLATIPGSPRGGFFSRALDSFVRLLTFQQVSLTTPVSADSPRSLTLKRVIAIPGDTIMMEGGEYRIKTAGSDIFIIEKEIVGRSYSTGRETVIPGWIDGLPGSGRMEAVTLPEGRYFLAGDSRKDSSDSRLWGPADSGSIVALALFRFWPPSRIGRP